MRRRGATLLLLWPSALWGCRLDQGLSGKDVGGGDDTAVAADSGVDSATDTGRETGSDTGADVCADFAVRPAELAAENDACGVPAPVDDPWDVEVEAVFEPIDRDAIAWTAASFPPVAASRGAACVGVGSGADSCVAVADSEPAGFHVQVYGGLDGVAEGQLPGGAPPFQLAWIDVDGDGEAELVNFEEGWTSDGHLTVRASEADGTLLWATEVNLEGVQDQEIVAADLDDDGIADVLADRCALDGPTGELLFCLDDAYPEHRSSTGLLTADIDLDGSPEILWGGTVYRADGTPWWRTEMQPHQSVHPFVIQADGDPEAEVGWVSDQWMLYDHDGHPKFDAPKSFGRPRYRTAAPCVGDFDGDGVSEAAWADGDKLVMVDMDGSVKWTVSADAMNAGFEGCAGWDVDGDGALEVLYADMTSFRILDGRDGSVLYEIANQDNITIANGPTVADLDGDGHAEILFSTGNVDGKPDDWGIVVALQQADHTWPAAGPAWPTFDYAVRNVTPTGGVPAVPPDYWNDPGVLRGRLATDDTLPLRADLVARVTSVCAVSCDTGPVRVALQAGNEGPVDVPAGYPWALYAVDDTGERLVSTGLLPELPAYAWAEGWEVDLVPADLGTRGLRLAVDDDGAGQPRLWECDETDNDGTWNDSVCP